MLVLVRIFAASKLLFILNWSKLMSKDVVILLIRNCDGILAGISSITSVASERNVFRVNSSSLICSDYWCCCSVKFINYSSSCSKIWSDLSNFAWSLVSKQSSEDKDSEVIVTILFSIYSYENLFGSILCSHLNSISCSYCFSKHWLDG